MPLTFRVWPRHGVNGYYVNIDLCRKMLAYIIMSPTKVMARRLSTLDPFYVPYTMCYIHRRRIVYLARVQDYKNCFKEMVYNPKFQNVASRMLSGKSAYDGTTRLCLDQQAKGGGSDVVHEEVCRNDMRFIISSACSLNFVTLRWKILFVYSPNTNSGRTKPLKTSALRTVPLYLQKRAGRDKR